jgi:hypothetical protein
MEGKRNFIHIKGADIQREIMLSYSEILGMRKLSAYWVLKCSISAALQFYYFKIYS